MDRQVAAINQWLLDHPEYELDREIRHVGSGAKSGRFEWFITELQQGRLPRGTCLVVEKVSRLGREALGETLKTLLRIFDVGGSIAVCQLFGGAVLEDFEGHNGAIYSLAGAIDAARIEWEDRRDRKLFADKTKHQRILDGEKPFRQRDAEKSRSDYPFWLNFNDSTGTFELVEKHARWIQKAFDLAELMGSHSVAKRLHKMGVRCPTETDKSLSFKAVNKLLKNRALLGERQLYHTVNGRSVPKGKPVKGVYPPVITQQQWERTQSAIDRRHNGQTPTGACMYNLFERRIVCSQCGGIVSFKNNIGRLAGGIKKLYPKLYCLNSKARVDVCDAPYIGYDEHALLDRIQSFRWSEYFNDSSHEKKVSKANKLLLDLQADKEEKAQRYTNIESGYREALRIGKPLGIEVAGNELEIALDVFNEAERRVNLAQGELDGLRRRPTGSAMERVIREKVGVFKNAGLVDIDARREFNGWLASEQILIELNLKTGQFELGTGIYGSDGKLEGLDQRLEDAAALGINLQDARQAIAVSDGIQPVLRS